MGNGLGKINNSRKGIDHLIIKDRSLGAEKTKIQTKATRKILEEYSFKDRSFQDKDQSLPFYNSLSEILGKQTPRIPCQGSILHYKFKFVTFLEIFTGSKSVFGPKHVFSSDFQVETGH